MEDFVISDTEREKFVAELAKELAESLDRFVIKAWEMQREADNRAALRRVLDQAPKILQTWPDWKLQAVSMKESDG